MTRGERVIAFIEAFCLVPEGALVGRPMRLEQFQKEFILAVYDNPNTTLKAILSMARKNGKTALIAALVLVHICGPEARLNSQIVSGALSREQAGIVYKLAEKMVRLSPKLRERVRCVPSTKTLIGLGMNVEFKALAAEAKTNHGASPVVAILDEVGQIRGSQSDFVDAITTAQGAHENPLLLVISTQAPNDDDLLSVWIDDALTGEDPHTICHLHTAPPDCDLADAAAWKAANPGLDSFRSRTDVATQADRANRMPSFEPTFRNLILNQRVEMYSPFITKRTWLENGADPDDEAFFNGEVYVGLDLSARNDLTAAVIVAVYEGQFHVRPLFWTPRATVVERSKLERKPYEQWAMMGHIILVDGKSIDYEVVLRDLLDHTEGMNIVSVAFDRWRIDVFKKEMERADAELPLTPFGQGFKDMAPAIDYAETALLNGRVRHGKHPVLTMCVDNSRVEKDAAGNRKLNKGKATGRIDGAVAWVMAMGAASAADFDFEAGGVMAEPIIV